MWNKIKLLLDLVKFEHTIFALPFAYMGLLLGARGVPSFYYWFWVTMAMIGARTAAMGFNRIIDRKIDALNPRTMNRHLPKGLISVQAVWGMVILSLLLLEYSAWKLNWFCVILSPLVVFLLWFYSYTKRFTWMSHFVLGLVEAAAPIGGWIAVTGKLALAPIYIGISVVFWLAGFDIIYSCQDYEFDQKEGLFSIPARFGIEKALFISSLLHILTFIFMVLAGITMQVGIWYWLGIAANVLLLVYEHSIIKPKDLSRLNMAFFNVNGYISMVMFFCVLIDVLF
jgi:4-hydroxybenzoate polyprenyltransferase